jgi:hypothetical protein
VFLALLLSAALSRSFATAFFSPSCPRPQLQPDADVCGAQPAPKMDLKGKHVLVTGGLGFIGATSRVLSADSASLSVPVTGGSLHDRHFLPPEARSI